MCIVVSCDCLTGVFAGFAVFATIGFLARELQEKVEVYAQSSGPRISVYYISRSDITYARKSILCHYLLSNALSSWTWFTSISFSFSFSFHQK